MSGSGSMTERGTGVNHGTLLCSDPVHSKTGLGKDLVFEEYVNITLPLGCPHFSPGIVEVPEAENPSHVLILRTGSPSLIEWRSDGRDHTAKLATGSVSLLPKGLRQAARITRPMFGVGSILHINPAFFDRSIGTIAKGSSHLSGRVIAVN